MRVLVAEDSLTQAEQIREALTDAGFAVSVARDGAAALDSAQQSPFDIVISDVIMPGLTGYELCRRLKGDPQTAHLPVMLLTTLDQPSDVLEGLAAGADSYLSKPFEPDDLIQRVTQLLQREVTPRETLTTAVEASFMGRRFTLAFDSAQLVEYFLTSFEDYVRARARQEAERRTSESLRDALRFVESTFDALAVQVAIVDETGEILGVNASWRRFVDTYGLRARGWDVGVNYLEQLESTRGPDEADAARLARGIREVIAGSSAFSMQYARCETEQERWCNVHVTRFELGGRVRLVVAHDDVTEQMLAARRQRAQFEVTRALIESHSLRQATPGLLRAMSEGTAWDGGQLWIARGSVLRCVGDWSAPDPAIAHFIESARDVELGRGDGLPGAVWAAGQSQWLGDLTQAAPFARRDDALAAGLHAAAGIPIRASDQVAGVLVLFSRRTRSPNSAVLAVLEDVAKQIRHFLQRVDAQRELERRAEALREQAIVLQSVFDGVADGIVIAGADGSLLTHNRAAEQIMGGRPTVAALPLPRALAGQSVNDELIVRPDPRSPDEQQHLSLAASPLVDESGRRLGAMAVVRDLTKQVRAEATLRAREEQLREAQKLEAVGRLAGGVAHDFNNLLTVILSYSGFLSAELEGGGRDDAREIEAAAHRAAALTRQLLAFSRKQVLEPRVFELNAAVTSMTRMLGRLIGADVRLQMDVQDEEIRVLADPAEVERILVNLVVNARDAMPGGGDVAVRVTAVELTEPGVVPAGAYALLEVTDGGVGMSDEVKERLFEPFFTTKEVGKGTGLGMATVYGSIRQMGGQIEVDSAQGRGTTVRVLLPSVEQAATRERRETPLDETVRGAGETVLVVDDDAAVRKAVARMLSQNGYRVVQAEGPGEALLIAERDTAAIDVLLTDLAMPLMPGPELANRVRLLAPSVRVIFMTGFASPRELRNAVADAPLVRKPMQADELARAVRRAFERS